jgi:hypothetical protein
MQIVSTGHQASASRFGVAPFGELGLIRDDHFDCQHAGIRSYLVVIWPFQSWLLPVSIVTSSCAQPATAETQVSSSRNDAATEIHISLSYGPDSDYTIRK